MYERTRVLEDGCIEWLGTTRKGYGQIWHKGKWRQAHAVAWELATGEPAPMLDHTCHNPKTCKGGEQCIHRRCVNVSHLQPTTYAANATTERKSHWELRKTECPKGHPYDEANTMKDRNRRVCKKCHAAHQREYRRKRREVQGGKRI